MLAVVRGGRRRRKADGRLRESVDALRKQPWHAKKWSG